MLCEEGAAVGEPCLIQALLSPPEGAGQVAGALGQGAQVRQEAGRPVRTGGGGELLGFLRRKAQPSQGSPAGLGRRQRTGSSLHGTRQDGVSASTRTHGHTCTCMCTQVQSTHTCTHI